ncbi:DUF3068 domain-containing protein [Streptomyces sp. NPDC060194]|uniref:DUF3068 domain-containing protein n=1 Tax=Streptomyces sp. NPDC060194 TaxID=3347069 RepID=UPI00364CB7DA
MRPTGHPSPDRPSRPSPLSLVLLGIGVFLLTLAPLLAWYVQPNAKRTPIDIDATTVFTGTGSYFDQGEVETVDGQALTITRKVRGDVEDSTDDRSIWEVSTTVDTKDSLPAEDPRDALQWSTERWVTDRKTNRPLHCCEESPVFDGEAYLKFPFDVEKRSYRWWDNTLGGTVPLQFKGTKKIQGYEGYRFTGSVDPVRTGTRQVPGTLVGVKAGGQVLAEEWYSNHGIELVVDRATGRIIYAAIGPKKTLRAPGGTKDEVVLLDSQKIGFDTKTQKTQVKLAKEGSDQLKTVGQTAPALAGLTGLLLAAAGVVLLVRGRKTPETASGEHSGE